MGRTRRTPPPPLIGGNIAFSCSFWNKVKLTPLFSVKMWLTPPPFAHSGYATVYTAETLNQVHYARVT